MADPTIEPRFPGRPITTWVRPSFPWAKKNEGLGLVFMSKGNEQTALFLGGDHDACNKLDFYR